MHLAGGRHRPEPDLLAPPPQPHTYPLDQPLRDLYQSIFSCGDADLWRWPPPASRQRNGPPSLSSIHLRFPTALDESLRDALRQEALEQRQRAKEQISRILMIERGSVSGGFGRFCYACTGDLMHEMAWSASIPRLIAAQTGAIVAPIGACYNYYRCGDWISIHTDPYGYELVLLALLSGPIEPLHCHLELTDTPLEEIQDLALATGGKPAGAPHSRSTPFRSCSLATASRIIATPPNDPTKRSCWCSASGTTEPASWVQSRLNSYWNRDAASYDRGADNQFRVGHPAREEMVRIWRAALPQAPADVLDVGTGNVALLLSDQKIGGVEFTTPRRLLSNTLHVHGASTRSEACER